jgi:hypothetical protein
LSTWKKKNYYREFNFIIHTRNVAVKGLNCFRLRREKRHDRNSRLSIDYCGGEIDSFWTLNKMLCTAEGEDKYETGTNVTRTTKKTPLTTFMKGEEWRLFLSFLFKSVQIIIRYMYYNIIIYNFFFRLWNLMRRNKQDPIWCL